MGGGIAFVAAQRGIDVVVLDVYLATSPVTGSDCTASRDDAVVRANDAVELDLNRMRLATGGTVIDIGGVHVVLVVLA